MATTNLYTPIKYTGKSDNDIKKLAQSTALSEYNSKVQELTDNVSAQKLLLNQSKSRLDPAYQERLSQLYKAYDGRNAQISAEALSRGMGRSSRVLEMKAGMMSEAASDKMKLLTEKANEVRELDEQIDLLEKQLTNSKTQLSSKMKSDVESIIYQMTKERDAAALEALKYNNDLLYKQQNFEQNKLSSDRNYELSLQKYMDSLQTKSSSSGSSGSKSSGSKKSGSGSSKTNTTSSASDKQVLNTWNSLSNSGKLRYYNENKSKLEKSNPALASQFKSQVNALKAKGVTSNVNSQYNMYKNQAAKRIYSGGR